MIENSKFYYSDNYLKLIYGKDSNIDELRKVKTSDDFWNETMMFLVNNDITKIDELREMNLIKVLKILNSMSSMPPEKKIILKPIGFDYGKKIN